MPRGRLLEDADVQQYQPPEVPGGREGLTPEGRVEDAIRVGHAQGLARGRSEGLAALENERNQQRAQFAEALSSIAHLEVELVEACKAGLIELAVEIASRIVRERIEASDPIVTRVVEEVLADASQVAIRTIRVSPEDHHALLDLAPRLGDPGTLTIVPDSAIGPGGLIIEAAQEVVDARLETALDAVKTALEDQQ